MFFASFLSAVADAADNQLKSKKLRHLYVSQFFLALTIN